MIATGLVFVLGALVATLLALLFVPFLWRNAQRLARRDFAATMPATMNEIRAEVDRVRAEAAVSVRRHEMLAQKARERTARERAAVGRLTASQAEMALLNDQHSSEVNSLRGQIALAQERINSLDEIRVRLEDENARLKDDVASTIDEAPLRQEQTHDLPKPVVASPPPAILASAHDGDADLHPDLRQEKADIQTEPGINPSAAIDPSETARARVAAAAAALVALAGERRHNEATSPAPATRVDGAQAQASQAYPVPGLPRVGPIVTASAPTAGDGSKISTGNGPDTDAAPEARKRENADIRERIADIAARVIHMTTLKEGPASPLAKLLKRGGPPPEPADGSPSLSERVRRLTQSPAASEPLVEQPQPEPDQPQARPDGDGAPQAEPRVDASAQVMPTPNAKRRRGGGRSRQRSPR